MVPVAFVLMPKKSFECYEAAFNAIISNLKSLHLELSATIIMADFELGLRKAILKCFPKIALKVNDRLPYFNLDGIFQFFLL